MALKVKIKKNLILPVLKLEPETPVLVKITDAMHKSATSPANDGNSSGAKGKGKKAKMDPATVCSVVNCETGEANVLICGTVLERVLDEQFPKGTYVGKFFRIIKHAPAKGKRYNTYSVAEIEDPTK